MIEIEQIAKGEKYEEHNRRHEAVQHIKYGTFA